MSPPCDGQTDRKAGSWRSKEGQLFILLYQYYVLCIL